MKKTLIIMLVLAMASSMAIAKGDGKAKAAKHDFLYLWVLCHEGFHSRYIYFAGFILRLSYRGEDESAALMDIPARSMTSFVTDAAKDLPCANFLSSGSASSSSIQSITFPMLEFL
jgi:hypothetical protein